MLRVRRNQTPPMATNGARISSMVTESNGFWRLHARDVAGERIYMETRTFSVPASRI
jgi:hypothetical protein